MNSHVWVWQWSSVRSDCRSAFETHWATPFFFFLAGRAVMSDWLTHSVHQAQQHFNFCSFCVQRGLMPFVLEFDIRSQINWQLRKLSATIALRTSHHNFCNIRAGKERRFSLTNISNGECKTRVSRAYFRIYTGRQTFFTPPCWDFHRGSRLHYWHLAEIQS